jgi:hypothetical protein
MRMMVLKPPNCVHRSNPGGIEPRIIATLLIAARHLMLLFAIARQAIFRGGTRATAGKKQATRWHSQF